MIGARNISLKCLVVGWTSTSFASAMNYSPITLILLVATVFTVGSVAAQTHDPSPASDPGSIVTPELVATIDSVALAATQGGEVPGISVAIWADGDVVYSRGYGFAILENRIPVTDSTQFRIGSIAKQMTAAAVMRLVDQGHLSLADPISRHLPDAPSHWEAVTIHHLLTHTSGIPSYTDLPEWRRRSAGHLSVEEVIGMFRDLPLDFEPATGWTYSNSGYFLLGPIIEHVTGLPYGRYVEEELAIPLGLRETGACPSEAPQMAHGYNRGPDGFVLAQSNQIGGPFADGDLCSSSRDLLRWTTALAGGGLISPGSYRRMITRGQLLDGREIHYGYGFDVLHHDGAGTVVEHGGGVPGFRSHLAYYPEQEVIITVLTNASENTAQMVKQMIARRLFAHLVQTDLDLEIPVAQLAIYKGTYDLYLPSANLGPFRIRIFEANGRLIADAEQTEIPLLWQGGHEFVDDMEAGLRFHFEVENDRAVKLLLRRSGLDFEGERVDEDQPE